jgi:hypothetical protein
VDTNVSNAEKKWNHFSFRRCFCCAEPRRTESYGRLKKTQGIPRNPSSSSFLSRPSAHPIKWREHRYFRAPTQPLVSQHQQRQRRANNYSTSRERTSRSPSLFRTPGSFPSSDGDASFVHRGPRPETRQPPPSSAMAVALLPLQF